MRVAVVGASGLVGATLVERLVVRPGCEVVPLIHSSGNAWRLARLGIELKQLDLLDSPRVEAVLAGCTHVVNCSRGGDDVMLQGLKHLLAASRKAGAKQFLHVSSVMVYGDPPHPASTRENAPTQPLRGTYGWTKLKQDELVEAAARSGLLSTVLCPPNISGPYSYYLLDILAAIREGSLALLDEGAAPCLLVDVTNLCHAIELALERGPGDGRRLFLTDDESVTWRALLDGLAPLLPAGAIDRLPRLSLEALRKLCQPPAKSKMSPLRSVKHLFSADVRPALCRDPLWEKLDASLRRSVSLLGRSMEDRLRLSIDGPLSIPKAPRAPRVNTQLSSHQLRSVRHDCALAKERLGYRPVASFQHSMAAFRAWYAQHCGTANGYEDLLGYLG